MIKNDKETIVSALGLMSGTSLDGLDMALCTFREFEGRWAFTVDRATTYPYPYTFRNWLRSQETASAPELAFSHMEYGRFLGERVNDFLFDAPSLPDLVASHGQTLFHQPAKGMTFQLGSGAAIAAACGLPVVCDFRSGDVALGGQGAPLVPVGDELLFGDYDYCLNLGGFSNISLSTGSVRVAYDISPCNLVLNRLAAGAGRSYDEDGAMAAAGRLIPTLLEDMLKLEYFRRRGPKSLGKEWVTEYIDPLLDRYASNVQDSLRTFTELIAVLAAENFQPDKSLRVLVTGGGAHNLFLMDRIRALSPAQIIVPDSLTVDFKEALIFAFLGTLRYLGKINILSTVTGAARDQCGGCIYLPSR